MVKCEPSYWLASGESISGRRNTALRTVFRATCSHVGVCSRPSKKTPPLERACVLCSTTRSRCRSCSSGLWTRIPYWTAMRSARSLKSKSPCSVTVSPNWRAQVRDAQRGSRYPCPGRRSRDRDRRILLETFVGAELQKLITWSETPHSLMHFRTQRAQEVDFVIERADQRTQDLGGSRRRQSFARHRAVLRRAFVAVRKPHVGSATSRALVADGALGFARFLGREPRAASVADITSPERRRRTRPHHRQSLSVGRAEAKAREASAKPHATFNLAARV